MGKVFWKAHPDYRWLRIPGYCTCAPNHYQGSDSQCIYIICRNGRSNLEKKWKRWLHDEDAEKLCKATNITVLNGDIVEMDINAALSTLRPKIDIIIHAASLINVARPLGKIKDIIIGASEKLAGFALECGENLERFVYVSTAFANAHLYQTRSDTVDVDIEERIYPSAGSEYDTTAAEWEEAQKHSEPHLTEQLLHNMLGEKLLIVRPLIIAPVQSTPFEGFSVPLSTPSTMLAAAVMITPSWHMTFSTRSTAPQIETSNGTNHVPNSLP
ncbi:hypothetical protein VTN77DRAFT_1335 [Rasamsonia byssochlamydoides]|uniref:uncharacterized protein n=1 Tax=Rasamsonia byssochlamydoides TaxID=89139 RepID=UPI00374283D0